MYIICGFILTAILYAVTVMMEREDDKARKQNMKEWEENR